LTEGEQEQEQEQEQGGVFRPRRSRKVVKVLEFKNLLLELLVQSVAFGYGRETHG